MARHFSLGPIEPAATIIFLGADIAFTLPSGPVQILGTSYLLVDDLGLGNNVAVTGAFVSGTATVNYGGGPGWAQRFTWVGTFYAAV